MDLEKGEMNKDLGKEEIKEIRKKTGIRTITAFERNKLLPLLPTKNNYDTLLRLKTVREQLEWTESEWKTMVKQAGEKYKDNRGYEIEVPAGQVVFEFGLIVDKEIDFGEVVFDLLSKILKKLEEKGDLENDLISLYEKFVVNK